MDHHAGQIRIDHVAETDHEGRQKEAGDPNQSVIADGTSDICAGQDHGSTLDDRRQGDIVMERNLDFDTVIDRSNTKCLKYDFAKKRGMPEDVLPMWVADMDFRTSSYFGILAYI